MVNVREHVAESADAVAPPQDGNTILLLHGFADTAESFDWVAAALTQRGFRVVAPDLRGFGDSEWVGDGSSYHFPEYPADVVALLESFDLRQVHLVGHSLGGTIAVLVAALCPARIRRLVLAEGVGPPSSQFARTPERYAQWLRDLEVHRRSPSHRTFGTLDDVVHRLRSVHPEIPAEVLRARAGALTCSEGDRLRWRYDPLHRITSPVPFFIEPFRAFLERIECPTLFVSGGESGFHPPDESSRLDAIREVRRLVLPDAGHMMHWTRPQELASAIASFCNEGRETAQKREQ